MSALTWVRGPLGEAATPDWKYWCPRMAGTTYYRAYYRYEGTWQHEVIADELPTLDAAKKACQRHAEQQQALVDSFLVGIERRGQLCRCTRCRCPAKLDMPSEWSSGICIFCRTGEHRGCGLYDAYAALPPKPQTCAGCRGTGFEYIEDREAPGEPLKVSCSFCRAALPPILRSPSHE